MQKEQASFDISDMNNDLRRPALPEFVRPQIICGVVEGFYGRPWTLEQRKHLFSRLKRLGMNMYLYAPKDDLKHRAEWRILYTDEETEILEDLIISAKENGVTFVYALSPGIDIIYSHSKEVKNIKDKLDQVHHDRLLYGNTLNLSECWYSLFINFSLFRLPLQTKCTNTSMLLNSCSVLQWDMNLMCILILCILITYFEALFVKIIILLIVRLYFKLKILFCHHYGLFSDMDAPNISNSSATLEAGSVSPVACLAVDTARPLNLYHPLHSLKNSVMLWIEEFNSGSGPTIPPVDINGEAIESASDKPRPSDIADTTPSQDSTIQLEEIIQAVVLPECKNPFSSPASDTIQPINSLTADYGEPMELVASNKDDHVMELVDDTEDNADVVMAEIGTTDYEQVCTLVDMFFLPFECGRRAVELLEEFSWLHENAMVMTDTTICKEKLELTQEEWCRRFESLSDIIKNVNNIFKFIADCPNKVCFLLINYHVHTFHYVFKSITISAISIRANTLCMGSTRKLCSFARCSKMDEKRFSHCPTRLLASGGAIVQLFMNKALLPLSIVNYELRPFVEADLEALSLLAMTNVTKDIELLQLRKDIFLDKYIMPFIHSQARHCFVAEEMMDSGERKVMCCAAAHQNGRDLYRTLHSHISSIKEKYSDRLLHGVQVSSHLCEVDEWYPVIPDDIFDHFPAWMDARFVVEPYDTVPTKKLVQTIAATLAINGTGCSGVFVSFPICEQEHIQFFARIGFSELGCSVDGRFFLLGHLLASRTSTSDDTIVSKPV
uniref:Bifunctional protein NCOAT n=1 Tax=Heterorhabditis bacteriophora TaxID=37862 RepID=A0A1I7WY27_HETBA